MIYKPRFDNMKFRGNPVTEIELTRPKSKHTLKAESAKNNNVKYMKKVISAVTVKVNGETGSPEDFEEMWGNAYGEEMVSAFHLCVCEAWPEDAEEVPVRCICPRGHIKEVIINVNNLERTDNPSPHFEIKLKDPFEIGDDEILNIHGSIGTVDTMIAIENIAGQRPIEAAFRMIAACCSSPESSKMFNLATVGELSSRDRKKIERKLQTLGIIVNTTLEEECDECELQSRGSVNLLGFI